jgi:hypothetical protein
LQAKATGKSFAYFSDMWNLVDVVYLTFLFMAMGTWVYIVMDPSVNSLCEFSEHGFWLRADYLMSRYVMFHVTWARQWAELAAVLTSCSPPH